MKNYVVKEAIYEVAVKEESKVETLEEHVESETTAKEMKINIVVNENKLNDECNSMKITIERQEFKELFGPKAMPHKGDVMSITGLANKYRVKKSKKFTARKRGEKKYKLNLQKVA
jgi:hypothetical protein